MERTLDLDLGLQQAFGFAFLLIHGLRKVIYSLHPFFICKEVDNTYQLFSGVLKYAMLKGLLVIKVVV